MLWGLTLGGCSLSGESPQDDQRGAPFVLGKSLVNAMDFSGAAAAFQEALEVSPHSAAAHYQLAWLYENKLSDPAAAIYHYQEYLALDPKAGNPDVIRQHIYGCKQQLVMDVMQLPSAPAAQQQIEKLAEQNRRLQDELDKWRAYSTRPKTTPVPIPPPPRQLRRSRRPVSQQFPIADYVSTQTPLRTLPATPVNARPGPPAPDSRADPYDCRPRRNAGSRARKTGVSIPALQAANPGLNPRHLGVGQVVNLPPS